MRSIGRLPLIPLLKFIQFDECFSYIVRWFNSGFPTNMRSLFASFKFSERRNETSSRSKQTKFPKKKLWKFNQQLLNKHLIWIKHSFMYYWRRWNNKTSSSLHTYSPPSKITRLLRQVQLRACMSGQKYIVSLQDSRPSMPSSAHAHTW